MASTRRMVLLGGTGALGALIVGYALWPSGRIAKANTLDAKNGEQFVTNWIKIATDGTITVVVPHCDMGTGIFTALPQMAAEELDADWSKVQVEQAPPEPLFANGALAEGFVLGSRNMSDQSFPAFMRGTVSNTFRTIAEYMNLQVTGGSSAVRATGVYAMRIAGAAAREMLVKAAAARWNVSVEDCSTANSRVLHKASGKSFGYGELVTEAANFDPSSRPKLKAKSEYTLVGKPIPRFDIPKKVNGTTTYGVDVKVPDMLYAAIKISPVFGAKLTSVDENAVMNRRGVAKVVKLDDAVVVVADRFWRARDAVAALNPVFATGENDKVTSASLRARHDAALKGPDLKSDVEQGDGVKALANGKVIEAVYNVPYLSHAPMEPMNATAVYKDGKLEVWSGTQDGLGSRAYCAKIASLDFGDVTFHLLQSGGAFGRRLPGQWNFLEYAVRTAMAVPGKPVKLIFTREQDMQHDFYRPNVTSRFRAILDKTGMPNAWVNDYTTDDNPSAEAHIAYAIPNQAISSVKVATHVPTGPWRSVEASWHGFFVESFVDELAHAAGKDPLAYRRALLAASPRHVAVLNLAAEKAGWGTPLPAGRARGVAIVESFNSIVAHVAEVEVHDDGALKVRRIVSAIDCGMAVNPDGLKAQIEGGILFGLSAALHGAITIDKGAVVQANFPDYQMVKLADAPEVEVHVVESDAALGGAGEPGVPPVAPALANAIFAATGVRIRELPIQDVSLAKEKRQSAG
ncbi:MAG: xanthine dehydrogenase family protein molybdopterin-binding subunit [Proteobacteria bacterium]|nr:xanthine dehydrogenase family protein molybdopterin-binding subunit [Pseudomonadota bacterium]